MLKGAMLYAIWGGQSYRPTHDLDFTGYGSSAAEIVMECFRAICALAVEDDGLIFDTATAPATRFPRYHPYPAYKDSGVEWPWSIPAQWEVKRLKLLCTFAYGDSLAGRLGQWRPAGPGELDRLLDT